MIMQNILTWYHFREKDFPKNKEVLVTDGDQVWAARYATEIDFWDRPEKEGWVVFECEDYFYTYHLLDHNLYMWAEMPVVLKCS